MVTNVESVACIRETLEEMEPVDRLEYLNEIFEGYCMECGDKVYGTCYCAPQYDT